VKKPLFLAIGTVLLALTVTPTVLMASGGDPTGPPPKKGLIVHPGK
jgi:hypothetical protein